jgi:hypothetical protein
MQKNMKVVEINRNDCLTTTVYDPSPNRFNDDEIPVSERNIPIIYTCVKCQNQISFSADDFQKHDKSKFSNLNLKDKSLFDNFVIESTQKTNLLISIVRDANLPPHFSIKAAHLDFGEFINFKL